MLGVHCSPLFASFMWNIFDFPFYKRIEPGIAKGGIVFAPYMRLLFNFGLIQNNKQISGQFRDYNNCYSSSRHQYSLYIIDIVYILDIRYSLYIIDHSDNTIF